MVEDVEDWREWRAPYRATLAQSVVFDGVGVNTGQQVRVTLKPAPSGSGILFRRTDLNAHVHAHHDSVCRTTYATTIANPQGVEVRMVEHIMSAFGGLGIDDVYVEIDGDEMPMMDGSALFYVELLKGAGIRISETPLQVIRILAPVTFQEDDRSATLLPSSRFGVDMEIDFDAEAIGRQSFSIDVGPAGFARDIAPARTFFYKHKMDFFKERGFAKGVSMDNTLLVEGATVLNKGGLRFPDEFVRHKILDAIGDLFMAGAPVIGRYHGVKSGHTINHRLLEALFATPQAWTYDVCSQAH